MDFWKGSIMTRANVLELTKQEVDEAVFSIHPTGNLIHVLAEVPPEEYGLIKIPEHLVGMEKMGIGYIIAVGPMAGSPDYAVAGPGPVGVITNEETSEGLLGLHVIFGAHRGMPLRVNMLDREFRAQVYEMSPKDIVGVDENPIPLSTRVVERLKK